MGFTKKIKHLDGHTVEVVRTEVTKPGMKEGERRGEEERRRVEGTGEVERRGC